MKMMFWWTLELEDMELSYKMSGAGELHDNMATLRDTDLDDFASAHDFVAIF